MVEKSDLASTREPGAFLRFLDDANAAVAQGVTVVERSRRNRVVVVTPTSGPGVVVKQGVGSEGARAVAREADIYRLLGQRPALRGRAPTLRESTSGGLVLLAAGADATTLHDEHVQRGRISTRQAAQLGATLARLHESVPGDGERFPLAPLPWVFSCHHPTLAEWRGLSGASRQLLRIIMQAPAFSAALDALTVEWELSAPIHGDLRWSNCLVLTRPAALNLVDWEFSGLGDPAWDLGCAFAEHLLAWLRSVPIVDAEAPEQFLSLAGVPLPSQQPAIAALWRAWRDRAALPAAALAGVFERAVRYCGARLAQTAFEAAQEQARPEGLLIVQLQLALNILLRPVDAAERLLALRPRPHGGT